MSKQEDAKKEALRLLRRARRTSKLKNLDRIRENEEGMLCHPNGVRYEEIMDDVADLRAVLQAAELKLEDIRTSEAELSRLKSASVRLNAPHAASVKREREGRHAYTVDGEDSP